MKAEQAALGPLLVWTLGIIVVGCGDPETTGEAASNAETAEGSGAAPSMPTPSQSGEVTAGVAEQPASAGGGAGASMTDAASGEQSVASGGAQGTGAMPEATATQPASEPGGGSGATAPGAGADDATDPDGADAPELGAGESTPVLSSDPPPGAESAGPTESEAPDQVEAMGGDGEEVNEEDTDPLGETDEPGGAETPTEPDATASFGPDLEGPCTASQPANSNASGSGPYDVVVETNSDPGIDEGTIFRPADLGGDALFPIFVWGEGGCSQNGLSNSAAMAEIASHGYFVVADGTPNGSGSRNMNSNDVPSMGVPLLAYIDWALAENAKPCSAYYHRLDATKIAANGFSCGGLMATGTAGDPRMTTWGSTSSGTFSANQALYESVHTPVLIVEGGPSDIAYENGSRDYESISALGHPIMFFSKDIGHGGDLFQGGSGDFTKINLAWLNWWLKGDETATGKGMLVGASCAYCSDSEWEVESANLP